MRPGRNSHLNWLNLVGSRKSLLAVTVPAVILTIWISSTNRRNIKQKNTADSVPQPELLEDPMQPTVVFHMVMCRNSQCFIWDDIDNRTELMLLTLLKKIRVIPLSHHYQTTNNYRNRTWGKSISWKSTNSIYYFSPKVTCYRPIGYNIIRKDLIRRPVAVLAHFKLSPSHLTTGAITRKIFKNTKQKARS